jgi:hypothetical protein
MHKKKQKRKKEKKKRGEWGKESRVGSKGKRG